MFEESFTMYFLSLIRSLFAESALTDIIKRSVCWARKQCRESAFVNLLLRFFAWISVKVTESRVYDWLGKGVFTENYYSGSVFYALLNKAVEIVCMIASAVRGGVRRVSETSLTYAVVKRVSGWKYFSVDVFLALFIGVMFIAPHDYWNNLYACMAAVFFAAWVMIDIASGKLRVRSAEKISLSLIVFAVAIAVSVVTAIVVSDALRISLFMIAAMLLSLSVYASVDTREKLVRFIEIVLAFVTLTAVFGFIQRAMGVEVDLEFVDITANEGMPGRVFSTFSNPNNFAELLLLFMPFFVPLFLCVKKKSEKTLVFIAFAVTVGALIMTYSRSCWVGFALAAVLFVLLYDKRLIIPAAIVVLIAIPFLPEAVINRIFTIGSLDDSSNSYRLYIWDSCLRMVKDFFATGIGLGPSSFKAIYPDYAASFAVTAPHSHMLYMELILETGVMGFVGFMAYMYKTVKTAAGAMRTMDKTLRAFAIAGLSSLLGIAFVCCAEYIWFYPRVLFAFWIVPGIIMATVRVANNRGATYEQA